MRCISVHVPVLEKACIEVGQLDLPPKEVGFSPISQRPPFKCVSNRLILCLCCMLYHACVRSVKNAPFLTYSIVQFVCVCVRARRLRTLMMYSGSRQSIRAPITLTSILCHVEFTTGANVDPSHSSGGLAEWKDHILEGMVTPYAECIELIDSNWGYGGPTVQVPAGFPHERKIKWFQSESDPSVWYAATNEFETLNLLMSRFVVSLLSE